MVLRTAIMSNGRKVCAFLFLVLFALVLVWSFKKDFESKYFERILGSWPSASDNNYYTLLISISSWGL
jgi:hypothetical protein